MSFHSPTFARWLALVLGLLAAGWMWWMTAAGVGVSPDSVVYLEAAKNINAGEGFTAGGQPLTHFPPGYPLAIAAVNLFLQDQLTAVRVLGAGLFGLDVALLALLVFSATRSCWAMLAAVLLCAASRPAVIVFSMAWSEPLFMALVLAALMGVANHLASPSRLALQGGALALGFALVTRYAGVGLLPPVLLVLFFTGGRLRRDRWKDTLQFGLLALLPLALWCGRNLLVAHHLADRSWGNYGIPAAHWHDLFDHGADFLLPPGTDTWIKRYTVLLVGLVGLVSAVRWWRNHRAGDTVRAVHASVGLGPLLAAGYLAFGLFAAAFLDASIALDERLLLPVCWLLLPALVARGWTSVASPQGWPRWFGRALVITVTVGVVLGNERHVRAEAAEMHVHSRDFNSPVWRQSATLAELARLPAGLRLYSNAADAAQFLTGRAVEPLPAKADPLTRKPNPHYAEELARMRAEVLAGKAAVACLTNVTWRWYLPGVDELKDLPVAQRPSDGVIFQAPSSTAQ